MKYLSQTEIEQIIKKLITQIRCVECTLPTKADLVNGTVPLSQLPDSLGVTAFVNTYADLPDPTISSGEIYYVLTATGTPWWPPGYKSDGFWISNGIEWKYARGVPINASLAEAIAGVDDAKFITSKVLNDWHALQPGGASGEAIIISYTAGEAINGGRALYMNADGKVYHLDITDPATYLLYVGIATHAAVLNDPIDVISQGKTELIGSGWLPGQRYWIAASGFLATTPPVTGLSKAVGVGIDTDTINIINFTEYIKT